MPLHVRGSNKRWGPEGPHLSSNQFIYNDLQLGQHPNLAAHSLVDGASVLNDAGV